VVGISVRGVRLPAPDVYVVGQDVVGEFQRNANGGMVGDVVAVKAKLTVGWAMLDDASYKGILMQAEPEFVDVEYYCPRDGRVVKSMYIKPGGGKVAFDEGGRIWWRDVGVVFLER